MLKMGRTQLQDAVPMTLGQEFSTYAVMLGEDEERLKEAAMLVREINIGATAIGTGINAHPEYAGIVCRRCRRSPAFRSSRRPISSRPRGLRRVRAAVGRAEARCRQTVQNLQRSAAPVERAACGLNEINLPPMQAGSSIMPGRSTR